MYYDETKQRSLFDKFDSIVINDTDSGYNNEFNITGDDLKFCEKIQSEFDSVISNLNGFKLLFKPIIEKSEEIKKSIDFEILSKDLMSLNIDDIDQKMTETKKSFIDSIFQYFLKKYNLKDFEITGLIESVNLNYKDVVGKIYSEFGDLLNYGEEKLKTDFRDHFLILPAYDPKPPELKNKKISVYNMFRYHSNYSDGLYIERGDEKYTTLKRAVSYFETGDITEEINVNLPETGYGHLLDFSKPCELELKKLQQVKFYKNRRVDLIFNSAEDAMHFFEMFDMSHAIPYRR